MTQDDQKPRTLGLSAAQVMGSALAAMSGAFFASWLGTTGTLIGAAVGSVIATVGSAIYAHSLRRTGAAVKRTASQVRATSLLTGAIPQPDAGTAQTGPVPDPNAPEPGGQQPVPEHARRPAEAPSAEVPPTKQGRFTRLRERIRVGSRDLPWPKVALASVAVLVVALAGITLVESLTGQPLASLLGRSDSTGTTVGNTVRDDRPIVEPTPTPEPDDAAPTGEPAPTEGSDPAPDPVDPTTEPSAEPSAEPVPSDSVPTDTPEPVQP